MGSVEIYDATTQEVINRFAPVQFYDDFLHGFTVIPAGGSPESGSIWCKKIQSTTGSVATPTAAGKANALNGTIEMALGGTAELEEAALYQNDQKLFKITQGLIVDMVVNVSVLPTLTAEAVWGVIGSYSASGPDAATYSIFFTADGSGEVICESDDNTDDKSATSGITVVAGVLHVYRIDCTDVTSIKFYIDGVRVASGTTFPFAATGSNAQVQPYFGCFKPTASAGAGLATIEVDAVRITQNRS